MASVPIHLPVFQKFDCQSCGGSVRIGLRADYLSAPRNQGRSLTIHNREIAGSVEETCTRPMADKSRLTLSGFKGRQLRLKQKNPAILLDKPDNRIYIPH